MGDLSAFHPGSQHEYDFPLRRFLPPVPDGMCTDWLATHCTTESWVIDPFGSSPFLPIEAAKAGYKVFVICNNPVLQFYLEILANAPTRNDFLAALADLSRERRQGERLEIHLQSLYRTDCPQCNREIMADGFVWKKDSPAPHLKVVKCSYCQTSGEFPINAKDISTLNAIGGDSLHRARALERVNIDHNVMAGAQEMLQTYLARPLHFLFTLINRIERLQTNEFNKKLLFALTLSALDHGNSIWAWQSSRSRPKQLSIPSQFREANLWQVLEKAIELWSHQEKPVQLTIFPEIPTEKSGICLYKGRLSSFLASHDTKPFSISSSVSIFPRPNQAFWSLSALWAGWLWGKSAVLPLRGALERRRFDWFWYSQAIHHTLTKLQQVIPPESLFWGVIPDAEMGFLSGTLIGAESAGLTLSGFALRSDQDIAQCTWKSGQRRQHVPHKSITQLSQKAISRYLTKRNEPAEKLQLFSASLEEIAKSNAIPITKETPPYYLIRDYQQEILELMNNKEKFSIFPIHIEQQEKELWWLNEIVQENTPTLSDRVEKYIYTRLVEEKSLSLLQLDHSVCEQFTGLFTPGYDWIRKCLATYAEPDLKNPDTWRLREKEFPQNRNMDRENLVMILRTTGEKLHFKVHNKEILEWQDPITNQVRYHFTFLPNSILSEIVMASQYPTAEKRVIIFPGSHSKLYTEKIVSNPKLEEKISAYGKVVKNRLIQKISKKEFSSLEDFDNHLNLDPPLREEPVQISIF